MIREYSGIFSKVTLVLGNRHRHLEIGPLKQFWVSALNRSHMRDLSARSTPKCSILRRASFLNSYQLSFVVHIRTLRSNNMQ